MLKKSIEIQVQVSWKQAIHSAYWKAEKELGGGGASDPEILQEKRSWEAAEKESERENDDRLGQGRELDAQETKQRNGEKISSERTPEEY